MFLLPSHVERIRADFEAALTILKQYCAIVEVLPNGGIYLQVERGLSITKQENYQKLYKLLNSILIDSLTDDCSKLTKYIREMHSIFVKERL